MRCYASSVPATPAWQRRLPEIRAIVAELETTALDRAMIEELFQVSRRQAIRLMAAIAAPSKRPRQGIATVVGRDRLLSWIDRLLASRPVAGEIARRRQVRAALAVLEQKARPRSIPIAMPGNREAEHWPQGIRLAAPGALETRFSSAEELLGAVLALTGEAARDYEHFRARVEQGRKRADAVITVAFGASTAGAYDGPLDLLLALVQRNQYPLGNLPIAETTRQYNLHLREAKEADVAIGGDFIEVLPGSFC